MLFTRPKSSKSDTPTRTIHPHTKLTQIVGISKKSDPFLAGLK